MITSVTPLHIILLIHCHAIDDHVPNEEFPAQQQYLKELRESNLIAPNHHSMSGYWTTNLGKEYLKNLCDINLIPKALIS